MNNVTALTRAVHVAPVAFGLRTLLGVTVHLTTSEFCIKQKASTSVYLPPAQFCYPTTAQRSSLIRSDMVGYNEQCVMFC